jgi:hypothetical protein
MGENQTDAGQLDALRMHLEAIRTESARIDPTVLRTAVLDARERLAHRPEPSPDSPREPRADAVSPCQGLLAVASAAYDIAEGERDGQTALFWQSLGDGAYQSYLECQG